MPKEGIKIPGHEYCQFRYSGNSGGIRSKCKLDLEGTECSPIQADRCYRVAERGVGKAPRRGRLLVGHSHRYGHDTHGEKFLDSKEDK